MNLKNLIKTIYFIFTIFIYLINIFINFDNIYSMNNITQNSLYYSSNDTNPSSNMKKKFKPFLKPHHFKPSYIKLIRPKSALRLTLLTKNYSTPKMKKEKSMIFSKQNSLKDYIPKKLSLSKIKNELNYMKKMIGNSPISTNENIINKNLRLKNSNFNVKKSNNLNVYNINNISMKLKNKMINEKDPKFKKFISIANNPCIGLEGRRKFKQYTKYVNYNQTFSNNYSTKNLQTSTLALRVGINEYSKSNYDLKNKNKLTKATKFKLKYNTINWFIENKKDLISRLLSDSFRDNLLKFCEKKEREFHSGLNLEDYSNLMINNNITKNVDYIHKLYWIFDENGDNNISFNAIISSMEVFRISSPKEKMKIFFNICNNGDVIKKKNFLELLKKTVIDKNDLKNLQKCVNNLFEKFGNNNELRLEQLITGFSEDKLFQRIINNNNLSLKSINNNIDENLRKHFFMLNAYYQYEITKMTNKNQETIPILTDKFCHLIDNFIQNKQLKEEINKQNEEFITEDQYDINRNYEDDYFKNEKKIVFNIQSKKNIRGIKNGNDYYILPKTKSSKLLTIKYNYN